MSHRKIEGASSNILGRWLHFGIALTTVVCLILSLFMIPNARQFSGSYIAFTLHKFIGLQALVFICIYLLWCSRGYTKKPSDLFPWFYPDRLRELWREIRPGLRGFKDWRLIPSAVQGLGIIIILLSNLLGVLLIFDIIFPTWLSVYSFKHLLKIHIISVNIIWIYLAIHLGAFLLHWARGEKRYLKIFKILTLK